MPEDNVTTTNTQVDTSTNATGGGQQLGGDGKTFTQAEMDAIIADRLRRQKAQFGDYEALKDKASQFDELQQAQMSELEKAQAERDAAQAERDAALQQATDRLIRSAVVTEAAKLAFTDPGDAFAMVDLGDVTIGEDGEVTGVLEAVKALAQAKPYLIGRRSAPATDAGAGGGDRTTDGRLPRLTQEETETAQKMGISAEAYAKQKGAIAGSGRIRLTAEEAQAIQDLREARANR